MRTTKGPNGRLVSGGGRGQKEWGKVGQFRVKSESHEQDCGGEDEEDVGPQMIRGKKGMSCENIKVKGG